MDINIAFEKLNSYCISQNFKGWDPYDGLNSKIFKYSGLNKFPLFRLLWIQIFKRNPLNFRNLFLVPKDYNAKGIGLFLSGYSKMVIDHRKRGIVVPESIGKQVSFLADLLLDLRSKGYSGSCWGYNFDWQARGGLYFPSGTPTVVATTYCAYALMDAYEATGNRKYLEVALDSANFVVKDLNRSYRENGTFLFSYSPIRGNNKVYNASLLGSKLLSRVFYYTKDISLISLARDSIMAVMDSQEEDGSWVYGELPIQNWKDSFHTGFNLECLSEYMKYSGDKSIEEGVQKGLDFYIKNFFTESGIPKYYHDKVDPIDIHSPAQLVVTLASLGKVQIYHKLVKSVLKWTIDNMQSPKGYFYYQRKGRMIKKIPYMRWSQAWMLHSLVVYKITINE